MEQPTTREQRLGRVISEAASAAGVNVEALSSRTGISPDDLAGYFADAGSLSYPGLRSIAAAIGADARELIGAAESGT